MAIINNSPKSWQEILHFTWFIFKFKSIILKVIKPEQKSTAIL